MPAIIRVGMGEYAVAHPPGQLVALGLGSCVGLTMYDPLLKLGALAHIMLPNSKGAVNGQSPAKFADAVIPFLVHEMEKYGSDRRRLVVKIAGGARMFSFSGTDQDSIGARNIVVVEQALATLGLGVTARSVGGNLGKSLALDLDTGEVIVRTLQVESTSI